MNSSFNITDPDDTDGNTAPYFPAYGHALLGCMLAFVFVFGSISNGLGILTFMKNKHLRSPTNTFILSLLISDFGMCFIGTPLTMMASFATKWIWGDVGCSMEGFLVFLFGMTNMYSLVAISVDRFVVIALPLHSSKITDRVAFMCCLGCWSIGLFWSTAPFFGWSYYHLEAVHTSCAVVWESDDPVITSYTMALFAFGFFFPVSLMLFSYCNVYLTVRGIILSHLIIFFVFYIRFVQYVKHIFYPLNVAALLRKRIRHLNSFVFRQFVFMHVNVILSQKNLYLWYIF